MRSPADRRPAVLAVLAAVLFLTPLPALAETTQSDLVLIREGDVVSEDLYAAGNRIQISGRVEGDLVASTFGELRIDGTVEGDVTAVAGSVVVNGVVEGSVRVLTPELVVEGSIGEDLVGAVVGIRATGSIGRDVVIAAWDADVGGETGDGVEGFIRDAVLRGDVGGSVEVDVRHLTVTETAEIRGDLAFRSASKASISDDAVIGGSLLERTPLSPNVRIVGLALLIRFLVVVFGAALGLAMIWATPFRAERSGRVVSARPIAVTGQGLAVAAIPFLVVGVVAWVASVMAPEAALPLLVVSLPFVLGLFGVLALAALVSPVPPAILVGRRLTNDRSPYAQFLVGYALLVVAAMLPVAGTYVVAVTVIVGIGAWLVDERPVDTEST